MSLSICIALYDRFTALDCVGPYDVLSRLPGARVRWLGAEAGVVRADAGLGIQAEPFAEHPRPDLLLIPGGMRVPTPEADAALFDWVREAHEHATWTTSVCSGTLVLAQLGLLNGRTAATHWSEVGSLEAYGARPTEERVVIHDGIATAAGVSAGIDLGLSLAERLADRETAEAIELAIEYDPQPPFGAGRAGDADEARSQRAVDLLEGSVLAD